MTNEQLAGIIRTILAALGGALVARGYVDAETATTVGGAITTIAVAIWSHRSKASA